LGLTSTREFNFVSAISSDKFAHQFRSQLAKESGSWKKTFWVFRQLFRVNFVVGNAPDMDETQKRK